MYNSTALHLIVAGFANGATYSLVGIAFVLLYKVAKVLNLALGNIMAIAGIACGSLASHIRLVPAILVIVVIVACGAYLFERFIISETHQLGSIPDETRYILLTLALSVILTGIGLVLFGSNVHSGPLWVAGSTKIEGVETANQSLVVVAMAVMVGVGTAVLFRYTRRGRGMAAVGVNPAGAGIVGINAATVKRVAFVTSTVIAAVGGVALAPIIGFDYASGAFALGGGLLAASMSGLSSVGRTLIIGLVLGIAEPFIGRYVSSALEEVVVYALLVVVLLVRPELVAAPA